MCVHVERKQRLVLVVNLHMSWLLCAGGLASRPATCRSGENLELCKLEIKLNGIGSLTDLLVAPWLPVQKQIATTFSSLTVPNGSLPTAN